jgi:SAM-dependent methyltransferase
VYAVRLLDPHGLEERAMGVTAGARLSDTQQAFDGVAPGYDRSNRENLVLSLMRRRTLDVIQRYVPAGRHILDLGCGPGTDAETLGRAGFRVTAVDWSPRMVEEADHRVRRAGLDDRVEVRRLGIHQIDRLAPHVFDAACSNFGPLNCVPSLGEAARLIAGRLRPGGVFVASVIGRVCPWELALYTGRGDFARARVRFARSFVAVPLNGQTVWTRYYTPAEFMRPFVDAGFEPIDLRALGLLTPPPYMQAFAERHPDAVSRLARIEDLVCRWPVLRHWGDHFLVTLCRRPGTDV